MAALAEQAERMKMGGVLVAPEDLLALTRFIEEQDAQMFEMSLTVRDLAAKLRERV